MMTKETDQEQYGESKRMTSSVSTRFGRIGGNESGVTAIEYALVATLIAVAILGSVTLLGGKVEQMWSNIADKVANAISG